MHAGICAGGRPSPQAKGGPYRDLKRYSTPRGGERRAVLAGATRSSRNVEGRRRCRAASAALSGRLEHSSASIASAVWPAVRARRLDAYAPVSVRRCHPGVCGRPDPAVQQAPPRGCQHALTRAQDLGYPQAAVTSRLTVPPPRPGARRRSAVGRAPRRSVGSSALSPTVEESSKTSATNCCDGLLRSYTAPAALCDATRGSVSAHPDRGSVPSCASGGGAVADLASAARASAWPKAGAVFEQNVASDDKKSADLPSCDGSSPHALGTSSGGLRPARAPVRAGRAASKHLSGRGRRKSTDVNETSASCTGVSYRPLHRLGCRAARRVGVGFIERAAAIK